MTTTYRSPSWTYLLLFLGGSQCFVDIQQSNRRQKRNLICMLTLAQRAQLDNEASYFSQSQHQYTKCTMASHHRRQSSVDRVSIESILKIGEPTPAAPPSPHVGNSPNRAGFAISSPPPRPVINHGRALSYTNTPRRPNRLSLSFPIAGASNGIDSPRPTPTSSNQNSFPPTPADSLGPDPSPTDASNLLVQLASQERRVLELKEELQRAEVDLASLKRQWATHEAYKKRAEARRSEPLQPLTVITGGEAEDPNITKRQSAEIDRRRALLNQLNIPKDESNRRKFSGTHTRALSLLSPERSNFAKPLPSPAIGGEPDMAAVSRSTTMPDTSFGISKISNRMNNRHSYQSGLTHGAKQIAEDIKAGVWTFMEDLRQATVGDEAVNGTTSRTNSDTPHTAHVRKGSKGSLLNDQTKHKKTGRNASPRTRTWDSLTGAGDALIDIAEPEPFWSDTHPTPSKKATNTKKARPLSLAAPDLDDEGWSSWDSPTPKSPRWSGSSTLTDLTSPATPSNWNVEDRNVKIQSTDGTTTPAAKGGEFPWPALEKLSPSNVKGNLQRTMSTLMKEWEKSITPPLEGQNEHSEKAGSSHKKSQQLVDVSTQDDVVMMSR